MKPNRNVLLFYFQGDPGNQGSKGDGGPKGEPVSLSEAKMISEYLNKPLL